MMVIKYRNRSGSAVGPFSAPSDHIIPADRCTWIQDAYADGEYSISDVVFYDGSTANGVALDISGGGGGGSVELGFIGKSGRFVAITGR